jgi:large subunit ribosomal protein L25
VYGPKQEPFSVLVESTEFVKIYRQMKKHREFVLEYEGKKFPVIIKDIQLDPIKSTCTHADFYVVDEKTPVEVLVPIVPTGVSPAVKIGAILTITLPELRVKGFMKNIPESVELDISVLENDGDSLRVSDITCPNTEILVKPNVMIARVELSRAGKKAASEGDAS